MQKPNDFEPTTKREVLKELAVSPFSWFLLGLCVGALIFIFRYCD